MKSRFSIFDAVVSFYKKNKGVSLGNGKYGHLIAQANAEKIKRLTQLGYKENVRADVTGGDHDYIVIDHKNKEWCWWENGFGPFCGKPFPEDHNLEYWANHRR